MRWSVLVVSSILLLAGCASTPPRKDGSTPDTAPMSAGQLVQTDFDRTVTLVMRDNLNSLYRLLDKLYRRNPREWRKSGQPSEAAAVQWVKQLIKKRQPPPGLVGLQDIQVLSVSLDPKYTGDRVAAFIYGLADTLIAAHNGKRVFYPFSKLDAQHIYNAARDAEAADWMLLTRRTASGEPLLLSDEMGKGPANLSFEREFGKIIGRLDLVASLLGENVRRIGIDYVQSLLLFNLLPVR
nr:hypothetical protein [Bordetella sp. FB-8]